jgi:primosomal protein N' (replication factor Y)
VSVQFGARKITTGIVRSVHSQKPPFSKIKPILELLFPEPVVTPAQLKLWEWIADYYMCTLGEVMRAGLPAMLKPSGFSAEEFADETFKPRKRALAKKVAAEDEETAEFSLPTLTPPQQKALDELHEAFRSRSTALLFGVPAAGKSEVAFHAIAATLARGRDVLMLVPEISLSTQFVRRVRAVFGERVVLYHSALSPRKRAEAYLALARAGGGSLVVGVRSAALLPLRNLGLVVVDEEQDASYKQQDPAPRYNARDVAVVLGQIHGARVLLASATPSLESWTNAQWGKYGLVCLTERYGDAPAPEIIISDTLRSAKRGERKSHFNKELLDRLRAVVERGEQAILFQNRRGIAPYLECADCGWVPGCGHCGIPMTVHRATLRCHYCGASEALPALCPVCGSMKLEARGFGTEKIEEELARLLPSARILRLDRDSATSERAYNRIISQFEAGEADILVGTQMVTKGLDFGGVSLVGILNADNLLNHPDFRASERAYQLIAQVAGRAGRRDRRGEVVIQTASPANPIVNQAARGDYEAMAVEILAERQMYGYPPYGHLVTILLRHADRDVLGAGAGVFADMLRSFFGDRLLGPQPPTTERIKGEWALVCMVKVPRGVAMSRVRELLAGAMKTLATDPLFRKITVTPNIDPQ